MNFTTDSKKIYQKQHYFTGILAWEKIVNIDLTIYEFKFKTLDKDKDEISIVVIMKLMKQISTVITR